MLHESHRRRQRLPAEVRVQHILDAALAEFSRQGYNAARMEDIARSAGLSKGGLYAHFPSKESLLQQLLARVLEAPLLENLHWWPCEARTLEDLVDAFVDHTLQRLTAPSVLPTIRLLLAEAPRLPQGMQDWQQNMMRMHAQNHERLMQRAIAEWFCDCARGADGLLHPDAVHDPESLHDAGQRRGAHTASHPGLATTAQAVVAAFVAPLMPHLPGA